MTFKDWYKLRNPDLDPEEDDMLEELKDCWQNAYLEGYSAGLQDDPHEGNSYGL